MTFIEGHYRHSIRQDLQEL